MQIQKIFSDYYDDERLYSVLMDEAELTLFSDLAQRLYTWQDDLGNIWEGKVGDQSKLLKPASEVKDFFEGVKRVPKGYKGGTGADQFADRNLERELGTKEAKAAAKAGRKEAQKRAKALYKAEHSKDNMEAVKAKIAEKKRALKAIANERERQIAKGMKQGMSAGLRRGLLLGGAGALAAGTGAYLLGRRKGRNDRDEE